jgi:hypothetical protein
VVALSVAGTAWYVARVLSEKPSPPATVSAIVPVPAPAGTAIEVQQAAMPDVSAAVSLTDTTATLIERAPDAPDTAIFYAFRGLVKAMAGDEAGAVADLDRAEGMTNDPEVLSVIGEIRVDAGLGE